MVIFPAIDLKDGRPVRLTQGDFATTEQVADDAAGAARNFAARGATHLHMVDLDGAVAGRPVNDGIVKAVVRDSGLLVEAGGGIRTEADIERYLNSGVWRVILGSAAISEPDFTKAMIEKYGARVAVGIDAKDGLARGGGWLKGSAVRFTDLARRMDEAGVSAILYTDIGRDGTLSGPNLSELEELIKAVRCGVIASGGVADIEDVRAIHELGAAGVICGKSFYKGTLKLEDALAFE